MPPLAPKTSSNVECAGPVWAGACRLTFRPGGQIYAQGDATDLIYCVVRGSVRSSHLQADGRRQVVAFYYEGDVFGVAVEDAHRFTAEALADCEVLALRRRGSAEGANSRVDPMVWAATTSELRRAHSHMLLLGRATACEKVARFLLDIADRFRGEFVLLPMSRQDMADYLGLTIETISRMLGRLQADGVIELSGSRKCRIRRLAFLAELAAG